MVKAGKAMRLLLLSAILSAGLVYPEETFSWDAAGRCRCTKGECEDEPLGVQSGSFCILKEDRGACESAKGCFKAAGDTGDCGRAPSGPFWNRGPGFTGPYCGCAMPITDEESTFLPQSIMATPERCKKLGFIPLYTKWASDKPNGPTWNFYACRWDE